ncbi:hypothetical protein N7462_006633 [Penicillium macrosclerotiorum]|uniref:uncharacterized protein n=1 Tax=Penicillium macrosclerotiorum TaxID=303699 RepID=UPI0025472A4C|nr:uncharacterized protein N7462_006633 [Penicillium macrosclerotiorum]KAJ5683468.1 hypothetical protein N7462_006633 [Penicillium macrosclerotiorum]
MRKRDSQQQPGEGKVVSQIYPTLRLEIAKEYDQTAIKFLVNGMRLYPSTFAEKQKTHFLHPEIYTSGLPTPIQDVYTLCRLQSQTQMDKSNRDVRLMFQHKFLEFKRLFVKSPTFEELLGCSQALILLQCFLSLDEDSHIEYSDSLGTILEQIAERLWEQAPIQLSSTLSPRHAWLLAESVRRTIIVSLMLRSAYSLKTRNYSVRTPFIDALPFDIRMHLWDDDYGSTWPDQESDSSGSMISLHGYSDAMENGHVHDITPFGALILAACKGKRVSAVPFPPTQSYITH